MAADARPMAAARHAPLLAGVAILAAATTLRPQIVAVGPLAGSISSDLGVTFGAIGLLTTATVVITGLAAPLGPWLLARTELRSAMALCMAGVAVAGTARAVSPEYVSLLALSAAIGVLIGIGQGIAPALGRRAAIPPSRASGWFTTGLIGSSIVAAALVVPLSGAAASWRTALMLLGIPVLISLALWWWLVPRQGRSPETTELRAPLPLRDPDARWLAVCFGLQAALYHSLVAWLPEMTREAGGSSEAGGVLVALLNVAALVASLAILVLSSRVGATSLLVVVVAVGASAAALVMALSEPSVAAVSLMGLSLGAILPVLVSVALSRSTGAATAASMVALMFLVGYVLAGLAPLVLGLVRDVSGDFELPLWLLAVDSVLLVVAAFRVWQGGRRTWAGSR